MKPDPQVVLVSYRGPVTHVQTDAGRVGEAATAGGLVRALLALPAAGVAPVWVCAAMTEEDRLVAAESGHKPFEVSIAGHDVHVRLVLLDEREARLTSTVAANPALWFVQHSMPELAAVHGFGAVEHEAFVEGYYRANADFADVVVEELDRSDEDTVVMLHDYHLYLVPEHVRQQRPEAFLHHFVHIPWPPPEVWRTLPASIGHRLLRGLLHNDVVGFHTEAFAKNFLLTCEQHLALPVDYDRHEVVVDGRRVAVRWYPVSLDPVALRAYAATEEVARERAELARSRPEQLVVRVDRADPTKNVVRGFYAFEQMLADHPEHHGRVEFLALVQPSRQDIALYRDYLDEIRQVAAQVNQRFGTASWQPVDLRIGEGLARAVAAFQEYDVLLVNPVRDGMNLVAKEGVLLNERDGVLVLSDQAGVHAELGAFALGVHPLDLLSQAEGLHRALTMPAAERHERAKACRAVVERNDAGRWLQQQLDDIAALRQ